MSTIETLMTAMDFNRTRTLSLLDAIANLPNPQEVLGWRPGPGRAHLAWQLMHIGITEELFATERLAERPPGFADLVPRYKGGSTPDDIIPTVAEIRDVLAVTREHLRETLQALTESDLARIPPAFAQRGWTIHTAMNVICWHEGHHQGQGHLTLNLWKAQQPAV